jgi:mannose-6-phosphate isomerase-like protein (cupin superfamily)
LGIGKFHIPIQRTDFCGLASGFGHVKVNAKGAGMEKKLAVHLAEAETGSMQGGRGTFRIFIDREKCGARQLSLLMNSLRGGTVTAAHQHEEESCFYILSGRGTISVGDRSFEAGPQTAVFVPARAVHKIDACPGEDLTYIMVYAPPGPEQQLKKQGGYGPSPDKN